MAGNPDAMSTTLSPFAALIVCSSYSACMWHKSCLLASTYGVVPPQLGMALAIGSCRATFGGKAHGDERPLFPRHGGLGNYRDDRLGHEWCQGAGPGRRGSGAISGGPGGR